MTTAAAKWGQARVDVAVTYARSSIAATESLKEEIAVDSDLDSAGLAALLDRQVAGCRNVVLVDGDETVESSMAACSLRGSGPGVEIVQSWSTTSGRSGANRLAYLFHGHVLVVITLVSSADPRSRDSDGFDHVVAVAAAKLDRRL